MISRLAALFIVAFWMVMTGLLVRLRIAPEKSEVLEVPVEHVFKLMFEYGQTSWLRIAESGTPVGSLILRPGTMDAPALDFSGSLLPRGPFLPHERVAWKGAAVFTPEFGFDSLDLYFNARESGFSTEIHLRAGDHFVRYAVGHEGKVLRASQFSLDRSGANTALRELNLPESLLASVQTSMPAGATRITARQGNLKIRDEKVEAYVVTVRSGEVELAQIWLSQLGEILLVKTPFGYSLASEDLTP